MRDKIIARCVCALAALMLLAAAPAYADIKHKVARGESLQGIANKYHITVDELIERNPQANAGVKKGMVLIIPDGSDLASADLNQGNDADGTAQSRPDWAAAIVEAVGDNAQVEWIDIDTLSAMPEVQRRPNIMVLLPFTAEPARRAKQYAEFYRGMLLAANELTADRGVEVELIVRDMPSDLDKIDDVLQVADERNVAVIVAPEDADAMRRITDYAAPRGIYVLNMFNIKDESHLSNPWVMQGYIDAHMMYEKAVGGILEYYGGYTPVILNPENGRSEKDPFVDVLRKKYASLGLDVIDVNFGDNLLKSDLHAAGVSTDAGGRYIFIPRSGAVAVFNRFAPMLSELRSSDEGREAYQVFGYPDWTAFRGEHLTRLYDLQAMVYSRFFFNEKSLEARALRNGYDRWYGESMLEAVPNQAALGYDTATTFIEWLRRTDGHIADVLGTSAISRGIQSAFSFVPAAPEAGYINNTLYLVRYMPDRTTQSIVL